MDRVVCGGPPCGDTVVLVVDCGADGCEEAVVVLAIVGCDDWLGLGGRALLAAFISRSRAGREARVEPGCSGA
jgi:hypothetical protein